MLWVRSSDKIQERFGRKLPYGLPDMVINNRGLTMEHVLGIGLNSNNEPAFVILESGQQSIKVSLVGLAAVQLFGLDLTGRLVAVKLNNGNGLLS